MPTIRAKVEPSDYGPDWAFGTIHVPESMVGQAVFVVPVNEAREGWEEDAGHPDWAVFSIDGTNERERAEYPRRLVIDAPEEAS